MKQKSAWYCLECGHKQTRWAGQCPQCSKWNTLQEEIEIKQAPSRFLGQAKDPQRPIALKDVCHTETPRIKTSIVEFDRLVGGGIVPGSLTLVGGEPGIGKSTLMLQLSEAFVQKNKVVLYVSGEESIEQTFMRAKRLGLNAEHLLLLNETNFNRIQMHVEAMKPDILIVDSIQIIYKDEIASAPGSVSQVRENTNELMHLAKSRGMATFLIGHVTKAGEIAGPKVLEHLVDTVLYFEGDKQQNYRMVRVVKNRFGTTDEIAVFSMTEKGLQEISNPSQLFLEERSKNLPGSVIVPTLEGTRSILIETQALVTQTVFPTPSRRSTGIDQNRLALLLAVLEKRMGYPLYRSDVFVSIAGGFRIAEPGIDLGVLIAIASSLKNKQVRQGTIIVGEVGLGGEVRSVTRVENRIKEAINMGFESCFIPKRNQKGLSQELTKKIKIYGVEFVEEAVNALLS